jgi:hypothetical protein
MFLCLTNGLITNMRLLNQMEAQHSRSRSFTSSGKPVMKMVLTSSPPPIAIG